jgi:hypothetical protein
MAAQYESATIPQPKPDPVLGNIRDLDPKAPVQSMHRLARTLGPIYQLSLPGGNVVFISSQALVDELSDEKRARIFVCGDARTVMTGVRETAVRVYREGTQCSPEEAERWEAEFEQDHSRFYADVFA